MKNRGKNRFTSAVGLLILLAGFVLLKIGASAQQTMRVLPFVCIGLGSGIFGHGLGAVLNDKAARSDPERARKMEINAQDERNVAIARRAKARAFDMMIYVFGALMVTLALMQVELAAILLLVGAYLFVVGCRVYFQCRYEREM